MTIAVSEAHTLCEDRAARTSACGQGLGSRFTVWLRNLAAAQRARNELSAMSDVELKDIGLTRSEIGAVAAGRYQK